jgi:catechol 2,3-dioxygenase-like lactoylglutathione lyase family enzyme
MVGAMKAALIALLAVFLATAASAQLAPPNDAGVSLGHIHLAVTDVAAQEHFFTEMMGGTVVKNGPLSLIQFPGVFIMLRKATPSDPPAGSVVDHFGFVYKDLPGMLARWKAAGVVIEQAANPNQGYVHAPDGVRIEFFGDPLLVEAVRIDHIHFFTNDVPGMQAWYAKVFGGIPGRRPRVSSPGWVDCDFLRGNFNLSFMPKDAAMAPTKGRSLDHIGFEVTDLDAFAKRLDALGIHFDVPPRTVPDSKTRVSFLTDPWGTYIEVTQNLAPAP